MAHHFATLYTTFNHFDNIIIEKSKICNRFFKKICTFFQFFCQIFNFSYISDSKIHEK